MEMSRGDNKLIGLLVLDYGTPSSLDDVRDYYTAIRRGKTPTEEEVKELVTRYASIGGSSPLQAIVKAQGRALQKQLEDTLHREVAIEFGHKFVRPSIKEAEANLLNQGVNEILVILMAPYHSEWNERSYLEQLQYIDSVAYYTVHHWSEIESFIQFWVKSIEEEIVQKEASLGKKTAVLFTAHSVPQYIIDAGDSYKISIETAFCTISKRLSLDEEHLYMAWQSAGKHGQWLQPTVEEVTKELYRSGYERIIYAPIGFTSLHLEVLYDNDIECKELCDSLQMVYGRARMPETDRAFIKAMSEACIKAIGQRKD